MRAISLAFLLGGWLVQPVHAADAQDWLLRMTEAERTQNFEGAFIYQRSGSFSTHAIWHRVDEAGKVRERLLQLDGAAREVALVDGRAECVNGALEDQVAAGQEWPARAFDPKQLMEWYDLRLMGESRVAGRSAVVLAVMPRDQHRYGFELHLDRETGLLLKSLLLNEKGQLLERFQFSTVELKAPDESELKAGAGCKPLQVVEAAKGQSDAWRSDWLPPGFSLNNVLERKSAISKEPVACLMYGDGLARFSVFLEPLRGAAVEDARSQLGPTVAVSKRMSTKDGDVMVTVVGEIPMGTAERVALSMRSGVAQATP
ncbi:MucB/RseB C-terminal domain-containing protein [Pseudomonas sp. UL073]|uniref:MucB/RseB C-terminal domain-containing protein n=1 Tax=Zestomonas insulae TaxID=2809017 RepID=A0ABS2IEZ0_9GAMM|nr:MucB/RseB C-terminal domain-containing protein [Pseudomonas insulae]MBM7060408.1 MucB/RseB C-terminal domain-containing protein [Pseudomonas insulae]